MRGIAVTMLVIVGAAVVFAVIMRNPDVVGDLVGAGLLPRITAWASLLYAVYGLARARISFRVALFLFSISFFCAYIGPYVPFLRNYY